MAAAAGSCTAAADALGVVTCCGGGGGAIRDSERGGAGRAQPGAGSEPSRPSLLRHAHHGGPARIAALRLGQGAAGGVQRQGGAGEPRGAATLPPRLRGGALAHSRHAPTPRRGAPSLQPPTRAARERRARRYAAAAPRRSLIPRRLRRRSLIASARAADWLARAEDELYISMQLIFHWVSPKTFNHSKLFTPVYICLLWVIYWYMAGVYFWFECRELLDAAAAVDDLDAEFCVDAASDIDR
eukprot:scaffold497_cov368-Prasinococcus_capsulatus_cf.AAC.4